MGDRDGTIETSELADYLEDDAAHQPPGLVLRTIDEALEKADLILLLVTKDFLASDYCNGVEHKTTWPDCSSNRTNIRRRCSATKTC